MFHDRCCTCILPALLLPEARALQGWHRDLLKNKVSGCYLRMELLLLADYLRMHHLIMTMRSQPCFVQPHCQRSAHIIRGSSSWSSYHPWSSSHCWSSSHPWKSSHSCSSFHPWSSSHSWSSYHPWSSSHSWSSSHVMSVMYVMYVCMYVMLCSRLAPIKLPRHSQGDPASREWGRASPLPPPRQPPYPTPWAVSFPIQALSPSFPKGRIGPCPKGPPSPLSLRALRRGGVREAP